MTQPVYKIETYTGGVLDHTITSDCLNYRFKTALTDQLGNFNFTLHGKKGITKTFDDIALFDKVKFYAGYNTPSVNPLFVGRMEEIQTQSTAIGLQRTFSGHDLGEVAARLILHQFNTVGATAHSVVDFCCLTCGFGTGEVAADGTAINIVSNQTKYNSLLKDISDYAASINKDWYVDVNNNLVWKARPIRTAGVSTLIIGENVDSYSLTRDLNEVYNRIYAFGATEKVADNTKICTHGLDIALTDIPDDHLTLEQTLTDWTIDSLDDKAFLFLQDPAPHVVTQKCVKADTPVMDVAANEWIWINRTLPSVIRVKDHARLDYWFEYTAPGSSMTEFSVKLLAPDDANYFILAVPAADWPGNGATGKHLYHNLGPSYEGASWNQWTRGAGNPNWYNITAVRFYTRYNNAINLSMAFWIDLLFFSSLRWHDSEEDAASQTAYGIRDLVIVDDRLHSNTEASNYADMIKAQKKDPVIQLDVLMPMDTNILIGDRIPITIPDDNLSISNFDVIRVEQSMVGDKFSTRATLVNQERVRSPSQYTNPETILRGLKERQDAFVNTRLIT